MAVARKIAGMCAFGHIRPLVGVQLTIQVSAIAPHHSGHSIHHCKCRTTRGNSTLRLKQITVERFYDPFSISVYGKFISI
jgi:hypothetical protein